MQCCLNLCKVESKPIIFLALICSNRIFFSEVKLINQILKLIQIIPNNLNLKKDKTSIQILHSFVYQI